VFHGDALSPSPAWSWSPTRSWRGYRGRWWGCPSLFSPAFRCVLAWGFAPFTWGLSSAPSCFWGGGFPSTLRDRAAQKDEMNLCVPNALASVLHELGFTEEAITINEYGLKELLYSPVMDAINMIFEKAKKVLPKWLQVSKFPNKKKKLKLSSEEVTAIFLGVMETSDGHRSHAVAVHGGYIYDANEIIAIPCSKEGLDYCTSTHTNQGFQISLLPSRNKNLLSPSGQNTY
jgi:hypothetical protein